jgi:hypothetical protein
MTLFADAVAPGLQRTPVKAGGAIGTPRPRVPMGRRAAAAP